MNREEITTMLKLMNSELEACISQNAAEIGEGTT